MDYVLPVPASCILCVIPRKKQIPNLNIGENFIFIFETKCFTLKITKLNNHNSILFLKRYFQHTKPCWALFRKNFESALFEEKN